MYTIDFRGKVALVTGGGRGIGLAITKCLAAAGATVVITYTSRDPSAIAKSISEEHEVPIHTYHCPGEDSERVNAVVDQVSKEVGEVDFVIANAGVSLWRELVDMTDAELHTLMGVNLFAPLYISRAFARHWLGLPTHVEPATSHTSTAAKVGKKDLKKKIIFISSISGLVAMTPQFQVAYNASKAGLTMAAKTLAGEWAQYGITVNSLSPGYISTDMTSHPPPGEGERWIKKWRDMTPVDRFADAKEIGDMVVMMLSDNVSSFMTGHDLVMDGGYTTF